MKSSEQHDKLNKIDSLLVQYLIGVFVCFSLFLILLYSSPVSYSNLQAPEGIYSGNTNAWTDFTSYQNPAQNFLTYNTFGTGNLPDYYRTIGYPAYLALMMKLFGSYWLYATYIFNCLLLPLIFPAVSYISNSLLGNPRVTRNLFLFQLLMGAYTARTVWIGNDVFFFLFFILGVAAIVKYFKSNKILFLLLYLVSISYAAEVRPTLIWFFVVNIFLMLYLKMKLNNNIPNFRPLIILSTLILAFTCNYPSIRNYVNYGFFQPSTVVSRDLFEILALRIYESNGLAKMRDSLDEKVTSIPSFRRKMQVQDSIAFKTVKKYPLTAIKVIGFENPINVMFDNPYLQLLNYYGYVWKSKALTSKYKSRISYPYKSNKIISYFYYALMLVYLAIYILFLLFLRTLFIKKDFITLLFIFSSFTFLLFPDFIIGEGGARFRITVEWLIAMFAFYELEKIQLRIKN
jgi:hypothetical protein